MVQQEKRQRGRPRSFHGPKEGASVQSLDRAVTLLKMLAAGDGLSLSEAASGAGLAPSTTYRMLTTLQNHGLTEFDENGQLWFVGVETFRIGSAFQRRNKLTEHGRMVMLELMKRCGETANLGVADGDSVVFISQVETHEAIRAFFRPGTRSPIHASGVGKAILAHMEEHKLDRLLRETELTRFTEKTIADREKLKAELRITAKRGWSVDDEEANIGMRCVASAIFDPFGEPVGGISVSGPTVRVTPQRVAEFGPIVLEAARQITDAIGGRAPSS